MNIAAARARGDPPSFGRRAKGMLPLATAVVVHILLLIILLSTRPVPKGQAEHATEISLIPGLGTLSVSTPAPQLLKSVPFAPDPKPEVEKPAPDPVKAQAPILATPVSEPVVQTSSDLEALVTKLVKSSSSLTADPVPAAAHAASAKASTSQTTGGKSCQISAALVATLQGSEEQETALSGIPATSRSVANAILLWDGKWIDPSAVGGSAAFGSVERAIVNAINQAPPSCQVEVIHGVRFVILANAKDTIILGFGSGEWRWADVAATFSTTMSQ